LASFYVHANHNDDDHLVPILPPSIHSPIHQPLLSLSLAHHHDNDGIRLLTFRYCLLISLMKSRFD